MDSGSGGCASLFEGPALDILYLALCWALTLTTSTLLTTIGPLSAKHVGASNALAPFTIGAFLFGAAFSSVPSGPLFRKYGRMKGFSVGCLCQVIGGMVGGAGMVFESIPLVFLGCFFAGLGQGLGQFYRFSAVEIAPAAFKSQAITYVLSGGILAAFLGPTTANYTVALVAERDYLGSYVMMGAIGVVNQIFCMLVRFPDAQAGYDKLSKHDPDSAGGRGASLIPTANRPIMEIISQPLFVVSCAVATLAHTIMVMVMSNCSLAMVDAYGYSFNDSARVMEVHFASMFGPGFFTGKLIESYGSFLVAVLGAVVFACSSFVFVSSTELWAFYVGMSLLGIAWNLSFSAGTVMLTGSYKKSEAADVQAVNDFILFTVAGVGSLISGVVFSDTNWRVLIYTVSCMMIFNVVLFGVSWKIKAELEESIRLAELEEAAAEEEEGGDGPGAAGAWQQVGSPLHDPFPADGPGSRGARRSGADRRPAVSLYQEDASQRSERLNSRGSRASRVSRASRTSQGAGARSSLTIADMFTPAPVEDTEDGRLRINSMSVV